VYSQQFHTSSHVGRNDPLLVYASTMNPHYSNTTTVQPLAVGTGMIPRAAGQEPAVHNPAVSPPTPNKYGQYFTFMWPCIVTDFFIIKPNRCTNFTNLFWHEILHIWDISSVHHQEVIHCTLSGGICHTGL